MVFWKTRVALIAPWHKLPHSPLVVYKTLVHYILLDICNRMCCIHCCKTCSVNSLFAIVIKTIDLKLNADAVL